MLGAMQSSSPNGSAIRVFIGYRRNDTPHAAGRIPDHLMSRFGERSVFRDIDAIEFGVDYKHRLLNAIPSCDVLLAVIGPTWASLRDRLYDERDVLRQELECALALRTTVVRILIDQTPMPKEEVWHRQGVWRLSGPLRGKQSFHRNHLPTIISLRFLKACRNPTTV